MSKLFQKICLLVNVSMLALITQHGVVAQAQITDLKGFHHTAWTSDNGLGAVFDIQQAPNGYLWLTTSRGVLRFDGVRFQSAEEITGGAAHNDDIFSVFVAASGDVWFSTRNTGLRLWKDLQLTTFPDRRCSPASQMGGVVEGRDGSLWIQGSAGLFHLQGSSCQQIGQEQGYSGGFAAGILVDHEGTVWVKASSGALFFRPRNQSKFQRTRYVAEPTTGVAFLRDAPDKSIWLSDKDGLHRLIKESGNIATSSQSSKNHKGDAPFHDFTFAPDGSMWAVTGNGIIRFNHIDQLSSPLTGTTPGESFTPGQGLSSDAVWKILIDREGSTWIATNSGLDRLRRTALSPIALPHSQEHEYAVAAGDQGAVWTGNNALDLTHVTADGRTTTFPKVRRVICVRRDRNGTIWAAGDGDFRLWRSSQSGFTPLHYPGDKDTSVAALAVDRNNNPWISVPGSGTYQLFHNEWINQNEALGKQPRTLGTMAGDDEGNIWFAFSNKLVRWDGSAYQKFSFPDGSLNVSASTIAVRGDHVWLAGRGGVDLFTHGHFYLMHWKDSAMPGRVSGIVETETGDLWINGFSGVTHVPAVELAKWIKDPLSAITAEHLDTLDGLPGLSAERLPEPSIIESPEGRLWFATTKGIAWLDPTTFERNRNRVPPTVVVESIISNGKRLVDTHDLTLAAHTKNLEIDYTALSLAVPERVFFRYKLEGVDNEWQNAGLRRQAFYNNLSPGHYRFRVIACNNNSVWNESGASLDVAIAPAFNQTWWFKTVLGFAALAILLWLVRLRISRVTRQLQERLAERLAERERIARELHDTLLQSLFGLMLRFQSAADTLPDEDPTRKALDEALNQSEAVMQEGRERVRNLRSKPSSSEIISLTDTLRGLGHQLQAVHPAEFNLSVKGLQQPLDPLIQEEILLIGREALTNAFRHSDAQTIWAELSYNEDKLQLSVRDNGFGINEDVLKTGYRNDHWGLAGMRERADKIRGQLHIKRMQDGGTQIDLIIPAAIAYRVESNKKQHLWNIFRRNRKTTPFAIDLDGTANERP